MPDEATLDRRLRAVERSLTDGDLDVAAVREAGRLTERVETLETELDDARDRIAELEAATQALRGYVGNVRSVNEDVERRADAALAAVERLEDRSGDRDPGAPGSRSTRGIADRGTVDAETESPSTNESRPSTDEPRPADGSRPVTSRSNAATTATTAFGTADRTRPPRETPRDDGSDAETDESDAEGGIVQRVRDAL